MLPTPQNQLLPETDPDTLARFLVSGSLAIGGVLDDLVRERALISLYSRHDHQEFVVSQMLGWDHRGIRFEFTTDDSRRRAILGANLVTVVGFLDRIKVQFDAAAPRLDARAAPPTLVCAIPDQLYRIQRRDAFRVRPPTERPAECMVRAIGASQYVYRVLDISASGVALSLPAGDPLPPIGEVWQHCRLEMPGYPPIPCDLEVKFIGESLLGDAAACRIGCELHRPTPQTQRAVQVYVMDVERKRPPPIPDET